MPFIAYDNHKKCFYATKKRPNNQSTTEVQKTIANRLLKYINKHQDLELTELQNKFIDKVKSEQFKFSLSKQGIDIAHDVAISEIIHYFVKILNNPDLLDIPKAKQFVDATCSTESLDDDKGRGAIYTFLQAVKDKTWTKSDLLSEVNRIINVLNPCSRNLVPGYFSSNRGIGAKEDPACTGIKGCSGKVKHIDYARRISTTFKELYPGYGPVKVCDHSGRVLILSSSAPGNCKGKRAYYSETPDDKNMYTVHVMPHQCRGRKK